MARDEDEGDALASRRKTFEPRLLDSLSVAELETYIADLKGEITRVEMSAAPPAENGTIMRIGLSGYDCADETSTKKTVACIVNASV